MATTLLYIGAWSFAKFLGFFIFLLVSMIGFWCLTFLISFVLSYWLPFGVLENLGRINKDSDPSEIKRKTLPEQSDVEIVFSKNDLKTVN